MAVPPDSDPPGIPTVQAQGNQGTCWALLLPLLPPPLLPLLPVAARHCCHWLLLLLPAGTWVAGGVPSVQQLGAVDRGRCCCCRCAHMPALYHSVTCGGGGGGAPHKNKKVYF
jgi:hypothetical protein